jgi:hypothetical protein
MPWAFDLAKELQVSILVKMNKQRVCMGQLLLVYWLYKRVRHYHTNPRAGAPRRTLHSTFHTSRTIMSINWQNWWYSRCCIRDEQTAHWMTKTWTTTVRVAAHVMWKPTFLQRLWPSCKQEPLTVSCLTCKNEAMRFQISISWRFPAFVETVLPRYVMNMCIWLL